MVKEDELHAQKDRERKSLTDLKNSADTTIYSIEKSVSKYKDKVHEDPKEIETFVSDQRIAMVRIIWRRSSRNWKLQTRQFQRLESTCKATVAAAATAVFTSFHVPSLGI
ncbi:hypothetical protein ABZP36_035928 [Zizania latifolia]